MESKKFKAQQGHAGNVDDAGNVDVDPPALMEDSTRPHNSGYQPGVPKNILRGQRTLDRTHILEIVVLITLLLLHI
jgi:hypothetical protein